MTDQPLTRSQIQQTIRCTWEYHEGDWAEMVNECGEELTLADVYECVFDAGRFEKFCEPEQVKRFLLLSREELIEEIHQMYPELPA